MTPNKLHLTRQEVTDLVNDVLDSKGLFTEIYNDIPIYQKGYVLGEEETHRNHMESDGREHRRYIFKDSITGLEHDIYYIYQPQMANDVIDIPDSIEIVEESVLFKKEPDPEPEKEEESSLTPAQALDRQLMHEYYEIDSECKTFDKKDKLEDVPEYRIDEVLNTLKGKTFNFFKLRSVLVPVCIEYRLNINSFWALILHRKYKGKKSCSCKS